MIVGWILEDNWMKIGGGIHRFSIDFRGVVGDQRRPRCAEEAQVCRGGPGAPPVWGFSRDLFKKRPKFSKNVEIT